MSQETRPGVADSRYESTFRLKSQNSPSSGLIARSKSWIHTCIQQRPNRLAQARILAPSGRGVSIIPPPLFTPPAICSHSSLCVPLRSLRLIIKRVF